MLFRRLLPVLLLAAASGAAVAQQDKTGKDWCSEPAKTDSAITRIQSSVSYMTPAWQQAWDSLLAECPGVAFAWQMKAMPNIKMGYFREAYEYLGKAVALDTAGHIAYQAFLKCLFSKDYIGALHDFAIAERLSRGGGIMDHTYRFYSAVAWLGLGDLQKAEALLNEELRSQEAKMGKGNAHHLLLFYLGILNMETGKRQAAMARFRQCLKIYPQFPEPNFYFAKCLLQQGDKAEATKYLLLAKAALLQGYSSNEDQEFYVNYPYEIGIVDVEGLAEDMR